MITTKKTGSVLKITLAALTLVAGLQPHNAAAMDNSSSNNKIMGALYTVTALLSAGLFYFGLTKYPSLAKDLDDLNIRQNQAIKGEPITYYYELGQKHEYYKGCTDMMVQIANTHINNRENRKKEIIQSFTQQKADIEHNYDCNDNDCGISNCTAQKTERRIKKAKYGCMMLGGTLGMAISIYALGKNTR